MKLRMAAVKSGLITVAVLALFVGAMSAVAWLARSAPQSRARIEDSAGAGGYSTLIFPYYADPEVNEATFARMLEQYRKRKTVIAVRQAHFDAQSYAEMLRGVVAAGRKLGPEEAEERSEELLALRRATEVWTEDEAEYAHQRVGLVQSSSAASARALLRLRAKRMDDPACVLSRLRVYPEAIDPAWREYLEVLAREMDGTEIARTANLLLCSMGDPVRRAALFEQARKDAVYRWEVEALLMARNPVTGALEFLVTPENSELARFLAQRSNAAGVRVKCARYLANTGERGLAEAVCLEVLRQRYTPMDVLPERAQVDYDVGIAKQEALEVLYYEIQTDEGLRALYEMAQETDRRHQKLMNSSATLDIDEKYGSPGQTDLDARRAQSLISELLVP